MLTDHVIDLMEERADVAIRAGPLSESRLVARKLGQSRTVVVAAPSYLKTHGTPKTPADLERHNRMGFGFVRHIDGWPFRDGGRRKRHCRRRPETRRSATARRCG